MATALEDFPNWLNEKLQELNTDEAVFGNYILGILDSDETQEEKSEALHGILSEIVENENEICQHCNEILETWQKRKPKVNEVHRMSNEEVEEKLAKLMESQSLATTKQKQYTEEEKKIRDAVLSQYSHMSDDEEDDEERSGGGGGGGKVNGEDGLEKNLNAHAVAQAEKIKREQAKIDSQKKKEKDKEDREKQKQLKEEKKEKRKTVKGERKR